MKYYKINPYLTVLFLFIFIEPAYAGYQIVEMNVRYYVYEDGRKFNQLYFAIKDEHGNYVTDEVIVTNVKLWDPESELVNLSQISFSLINDFQRGRFKLDTGQWEFDPGFQISGFHAEFTGPLIPGNYQLDVTTDQGQLPLYQYNFIEKIDNLPYISSKSFQIRHDSLNNVFFTWDIPQEVLTVAESYSTLVRAFVWVYQDQLETAVLWTDIPTEMGFLYIPNSVVQDLMSKGNIFKIGVAFQAINNQRAWSYLALSNMLTDVDRKKQVVVVPMF